MLRAAIDRGTFALREGHFYALSRDRVAENASGTGIFCVSPELEARDFGLSSRRSVGTLGISTVFSTVVENFGKRPNRTARPTG
jgi:hypothetical protein